MTPPVGQSGSASGRPQELPIVEAVVSGDLHQVRTLLREGADSNARAVSGWPVLLIAATEAPLPVVEALLGGGADIDDQSAGHTALQAAAAADRHEVVDLLVALGADPLAVDESGRTALHVAVIDASPSMVARLVACAPEAAAIADHQGRTPAQTAALDPLADELLPLLPPTTA